MAHIAGLPMYDFPELAGDTDALWDRIAIALTAAGFIGVPDALVRDIRIPTFGSIRVSCSRRPANTRWQPGWARASVWWPPPPRYRAPGCTDAHYCSAIVVSATDGTADLSGFRGRRCAINEANSYSGMNLLRAAVAPFADGQAFFGSVSISGSHRRSLEMVAGGQADLAAIDCVTLAHLQKFSPAEVASTRILCWTESSPSLPFITASTTDDATVEAIRSALRAAISDPGLAKVRENLLLDGFDFAPDESFATVLELKRRAEHCQLTAAARISF